MKNNYSEIVKHIPGLEDHGHLYMYYGLPYCEECDVYGDNEEGKNLIVSYECDDLCRAIADEFQYDFEWLEILRNRQIELEKIFDVDVEKQDLDVIASLLLYLVESITLEDKFIDALNNGYLIRLIKRLEVYVHSAVSEEAESSIEELLDQIAYITGSFPEEAIERVISRREEAIPFLLDILSKVRDNPENYLDEDDYFAHIYSAHLLAQFRVKEAYPILVDIMSLPNELPYDLFGDSILESGGRMLASLCGTDVSFIKALVENQQADEYMRSQAIDALAILVVHDVLEREEVMAYYKKLINMPAINGNPLVMAFLINSCTHIYPVELYDDIKNSYKKGLVDESVISIEDVDDVMRKGKDYVLNVSQVDEHLQFIEDTVAELECWACFGESYSKRMDARQNSYSVQPVTKPPKIGRNDPCPCGSGKKHKKCCGK